MNIEPTIVTSFYNIRKMENNPLCFSRSVDDYLNLAKQFILQLPYPLIIFIDDTFDVETMCDFIEKNRKYKNKTYIYKLAFKDTYFFSYLDRITELREKFMIYNRNYHHESPYYIILNNNKFDFMEKAIELNTFNSSHFIWLDFGINHVAKNHEVLNDWILNTPDKIKQMCLNPYLENDNQRDFFSYIYHHTSGGLFTGNIENMKKYIELFKNKVNRIYDEGWYQVDEAIMTMIQRENPDLFVFYYGDYQGIVSNYAKPYHNIYLIFSGLNKALRFNNHNLAINILDYLEPYFENTENQNGDYFYEYIRFNIALNNVKPSLFEIINKKISENDERIISIYK
jgi:hypothetical protein